MNKKQTAIIIFTVIILGLIYFYTPRYKITALGPDNYIQTEQSSSLYKRSKGVVKCHWDKIALYGSIPLLLSGILLIIFREKK